MCRLIYSIFFCCWSINHTQIYCTFCSDVFWFLLICWKFFRSAHRNCTCWSFHVLALVTRQEDSRHQLSYRGCHHQLVWDLRLNLHRQEGQNQRIMLDFCPLIFQYLRTALVSLILIRRHRSFGFSSSLVLSHPLNQAYQRKPSASTCFVCCQQWRELTDVVPCSF